MLRHICRLLFATLLVCATTLVQAAPFAYITNQTAGTVSVIDTATNTVVTTVAVGSSPIGVAANPAGTRVYVVNGGSDSVSVIDTASNTVVATVGVGTNTRGVAVNPAGSRAYVANLGSDNVSVIDTATNTVVATVAVGIGPRAFGLFIGPAAAGSGAIGPIPTLSQWGLLLLGVVLVTLGAVRLRRLNSR